VSAGTLPQWYDVCDAVHDNLPCLASTPSKWEAPTVPQFSGQKLMLALLTTAKRECALSTTVPMCAGHGCYLLYASVSVLCTVADGVSAA